MKKHFQLLLLTFAVFTSVFSQEITYERITTDDKILHGRIDDKYEISIYLKVFQMSDEHTNMYSLKGWYYYDKVKKKIPLVGIYDGGLTLYVFKSKEKSDSVLYLTSNKENFWDKMDALVNMEGFEEKFTFNDIDASSKDTWKSTAKTLKLTIDNSDYYIRTESEYLKIKHKEETKSIKLSDLQIGFSDFELVTDKKIGDETRILLKYECMSSGFVNGMCGAGQEAGYVVLKYDAEFNLLDLREVQIESCHQGIYYEEISNENPGIIVYQVEKRDDVTQKVTIDKKTVEIRVE